MGDVYMTLEQLKALGLSDDVAKKVADASQEELKGFVPKTRFDEVNNAKKQLETDIKSRDTQLEELKKATGDNESLKKQIETLQSDNKVAQEKYESDLKNLQISNAIKLAIMGKAQDAELVAGLFDKTKLILGEDGKVTGLDEQLKELQENKSFLFKQNEKADGPQPGFIFGNPNPNPGQGNETPSIKSALVARLANQ